MILDNAIATFRNAIGIAYLAWIGFLLYYFSGFSGSPMFDRGLGPTMIGLTVVFTIGATFMLLKLVRAGSRENAKRQMAALENKSDFDADGAIERYMANRGTAERAPVFDDSMLHNDSPVKVASPVAAPPVDLPSHPAPRGFGRRGL